MKKNYRVRRFKQFPKRSSSDVIEKTFTSLKQAQLYAIKLNESEDSQLYDTRWYVDEVEA
jgi:hypothetical protein